MQNSFPAPLPHAVPVLLRLTRRPAYWRVAVITPGRIRWRTYRREAYPEADAVLRRCMAGLVHEQEGEAEHKHHAENGRGEVHSAPPSWLPAPGGQTEKSEGRPREEIQQIFRHPASPSGRPETPPRLRVAWWGWL